MFVKSIAPIAAMLLLAACGNKAEKKSDKPSGPPPPVNVDVIIAQRATINNVITANGTVVAGENIELKPEVSGRLVYLNLPEGAVVSAGTVLARINDAELQAQAQKIKVQLQLAVQNEARLKKLLAVEGVNQADYDAVLNQVNNLQADLTYLQTQLDKTIIRAPFTGKLGLRLVSKGAYVTPTTVLATFQQVSTLKVDFTIPEAYQNSLANHKKVTIINNANTGDTVAATIIATESQVNTTTRNVLVRAQLQQTGGFLPGNSVKVLVDAGGSDKGILVPSNAIIPEAKAKKMIVVKNGEAHFVTIETGLRQAGAVEVIKGLNPGDSVVVTGVLFARPKSKLKVRSVKQLNTIIQ
ncbi:MAG: efflux RND transporter periplasmic adaptor subunit [Chitinophagaceae bacterium]